MNGWLKLHRKLAEWEWYSCPATKAIFLHCLIHANWKECTWQGIRLPRGSFFTSDESLASKNGLSRQQVRTALNRLKSTSEITIESTSRGKVVTVCKFDLYNCEDEEINQPNNQQINHHPTNDQPTINQRSTTDEEREEVEEGKKERSTRSRPSDRVEFDAFFREVGLFPRDAEAAWNKWEGNGWKNDGKPIRCWKSTVRSWKAHGYHATQTKPSDYEPGWPSTESTEPEEKPEVDLWATLKANKAKEDAMLEELAGTPVPAGEFDPTF